MYVGKDLSLALQSTLFIFLIHRRLRYGKFSNVGPYEVCSNRFGPKAASTIANCVLGLIKNPDALRKAQEEIDRVVGPSRLPDFNDEPSLPYISALVKEALRWNMVAPLGR